VTSLTTKAAPWRRYMSVIAVASVAFATTAIYSPSVGANPVYNATYYVGTTADSSGTELAACTVPNNNTCTLRDAAVRANNDATGSDLITFESSTSSKTITLTNGAIDLEPNSDLSVTIKGLGVGKTIISGGHSSGVLYDEDASFLFEGMTIENGYARDGGGIDSYDSTLTIKFDAFNGNVAYADDGGGVYDDKGDATVEDSTFVNNEAYYGGGILDKGGQIYAANNTFTKNQANYGAGASAYEDQAEFFDNTFTRNVAIAWGSGGGFYGYDSDLDLNTNTFDANSSGEGGGIYSYEDDATFYNDTIANNEASGLGGGLVAYDDGDHIRGSILEGNVDGPTNTVNQCWQFDGLISLGYNVVGPDVDVSCDFNGPRDAINTNAGLKALANNAGPTETMAITASSPALLREPMSDCENTDQRGIRVPQTGLDHCDAGAYELLASKSSVTCATSTTKSLLTLSNCTPTSTIYKTATLGAPNGISYTLTWKSSGKKTDLQLAESVASNNRCGSAFSDEDLVGAVTGGNAANTHLLDKVSIQMCVSNAFPKTYKLVPGTKAQL
jgi:hypothetical protein